MAEVIVPRVEAKEVIKQFLEEIVTAPSEDEAHYVMESLLDKLYPPVDDVPVISEERAEQCGHLLYQSTLKIMRHSDELSIAREHKQRDLELGPYLSERDLEFLKQCIMHNVWVIRWLVSHVKENP